MLLLFNIKSQIDFLIKYDDDVCCRKGGDDNDEDDGDQAVDLSPHLVVFLLLVVGVVMVTCCSEYENDGCGDGARDGVRDQSNSEKCGDDVGKTITSSSHEDDNDIGDDEIISIHRAISNQYILLVFYKEVISTYK